MKISVRVKPNARKNEVTKLDEKTYLVSVTAPPVDGKANAGGIELLAAYFRKAKSRIVILKGASGRQKLVEITCGPGCHPERSEGSQVSIRKILRRFAPQNDNYRGLTFNDQDKSQGPYAFGAGGVRTLRRRAAVSREAALRLDLHQGGGLLPRNDPALRDPPGEAGRTGVDRLARAGRRAEVGSRRHDKVLVRAGGREENRKRADPAANRLPGP